MTHDLVIRNGTVVDGTGAPARRGRRRRSTATASSRSASVAAPRRSREIDADGQLVTPGFVDIHTHLDAQLAWDPLGDVVVLARRHVGRARQLRRHLRARASPSDRALPRRDDGVGRGHPRATHPRRPAVGLGDATASTSTRSSGMPKGINVGGMVGHCAVRYHAMGERSLDEAPAERRRTSTRMCALVDEAIAAGALGFSTSRTLLHRVPDGRPVPGTYADGEELLAIGDVLGRARPRRLRGGGARSASATARSSRTRAPRWRCSARSAGAPAAPATFGLSRRASAADLYRRVDGLSRRGERATARGSGRRPRRAASALLLLARRPHAVRPRAGVAGARGPPARREARRCCASAAPSWPNVRRRGRRARWTSRGSSSSTASRRATTASPTTRSPRARGRGGTSARPRRSSSSARRPTAARSCNWPVPQPRPRRGGGDAARPDDR